MEDCQAICSNLKSPNLRRKCSQETLPITYTTTTRISDIEIRRGWPRILNQTWLLATTAMRSCLGQNLATCEVLNLIGLSREKLIVSISTARLCSDPNVFSPSVPQHFSHWFGETIGILPSTGIATRKALCRKLHWVCERLTSDVWILCSWDLEVQLYGVFECVRQNLFCRICCQHEPVGSARDLERMIWHGWVAFLHLQEHILSDFYLMFASGTHAVIILATAQAYESIADQWNDSCMLVKNLWWMSKKKC